MARPPNYSPQVPALNTMASIFKNPTVPTKRPMTERQGRYLKQRKHTLEERAPNQQLEYQLQKQCCHFLKLKYPNLIFWSDTASGRWEYSKKQLHDKVALNSENKRPDITILEPRDVKHKDGTIKHYCGLCLELKKDGESVILKIGPRKGMLSTDKHIQAQAAMLKRLQAKGYYCNFAVGYDQFTKIVDWYMGALNSSMF